MRGLTEMPKMGDAVTYLGEGGDNYETTIGKMYTIEGFDKYGSAYFLNDDGERLYIYDCGDNTSNFECFANTKRKGDDIMTKIKLPRAVTEAIEDLRVEGYADTQIVYQIERGKCNRVLDDYFFDVGTPDDLMQALVIGYVVEETAELPIVSVEHFGALNLLAHNYGVLAGLIANYTSVELDDLVKNGYRTKGESE